MNVQKFETLYRAPCIDGLIPMTTPKAGFQFGDMININHVWLMIVDVDIEIDNDPRTGDYSVTTLYCTDENGLMHGIVDQGEIESQGNIK